MVLLVFERNHGAAVAAEGRNSLERAAGIGYDHDRAVAVDGVAGSGKVPASAFGMVSDRRGGLAQRLLRGHGCDRQAEQQG